MLDHHPEMAWSGGFTYAVDLVGDDGTVPELHDYYRYLELHAVFQRAKLIIDRSLSYPDLVQDFLRQIRERRRKRLVGANVYRSYHRLLHLFPSCKFIHTVRDGRDVCRSWVQFGWAGNVWTAAEHWETAEACWDRLRAQLPPARYHEVRYEELIRAPEATLRGICAFIGIDYSPLMLSYPRDSSYAAPDMTLIDQWRRKLTPHEVRLLEARLAPRLQERGYPLSGRPPLKVGALRRMWLAQHDRYGRVRARLRQNGLRLVAQDFVGRRMHLDGLVRRARLELNEIEARGLK
jgi:hypothetical protein